MMLHSIDTAPKDGTPFLALCGLHWNIIRWADREGGPGVSSKIPQPRNWQIVADGERVLDEGWDQGAGWFMEPESAPTVWMPLPEIARMNFMFLGQQKETET